MNKEEIGLQYGIEASRLDVGECTEHLVCPFCNGGSSKERTFVIRKMSTDTAFARCYRDSCGARGTFKIGHGTLVPSNMQQEPTKKEVVFRERALTDVLTPAELQIVNNKCGTTTLQLVSTGVKVDEYTHRVMFPLFDTKQQQKGWVLRFYDGVSTGEPKPKAKTVWFDNQHIISLTTARRNDTKYAKSLILLEDWPSANRIAAQGIPAAAILGTGLSLEVLQPIVTAGYENVVLCLDADAKPTALRHKLKFSSLFCNFSVFLLSNKDVKDMNTEEFKQYLEQIYNII